MERERAKDRPYCTIKPYGLMSCRGLIQFIFHLLQMGGRGKGATVQGKWVRELWGRMKVATAGGRGRGGGGAYSVRVCSPIDRNIKI